MKGKKNSSKNFDPKREKSFPKKEKSGAKPPKKTFFEVVFCHFFPFPVRFFPFEIKILRSNFFPFHLVQKFFPFSLSGGILAYMQESYQKGKKGKIFVGEEREKNFIEKNGSKKGKIVLEKGKNRGRSPRKSPFFG